mmetsp:Transcript_78311/g.151216  ORF Transcript_78311/g.151216 Transcript_78311/m.151216 type:complete len:904 (+) Transcript_78311:70-2781(+)
MIRVFVGALLFNAWQIEGANLNGKYVVATGTKFAPAFNDDYQSKGHEFFDVWAPEIATHYGEVFWTDQGNLPLPPEIVQRFRGKAIAITGYEMDQVMVTPTDQPGANPAADVSVPINWAYNHHYMAWMTGEHSEMQRMRVEPGSPMEGMAHGASEMMMAVDTMSAERRKDTSIPTSQLFSEGNGGESRKSFHGYPEGYAQLVDSPNSWHITPMQIDTRNRNCGVTPADIKRCTTFDPGLEPRQARYGRPWKDLADYTNYSGLLECPCNGRYGGDPMFYPNAQTKIIRKKYDLLGSGMCHEGQFVSSAEDCFSAAMSLGINATKFVNKTVRDAKLPPACSIVTERDGSARTYFNVGGQASCNSGTKKVGQARSRVNVSFALELDSSNLFQRSPPGKYCKDKGDILKVFLASGSTIVAAEDARNKCEQFCWGSSSCWGCSVDCPGKQDYGELSAGCQWDAVTSCQTQSSWKGSISGDVTEKQPQGGKATITISGPADTWFGVGLNASAMADSPYTLIINASGIMEQQIGTCGSEAEHCPGDRLASSVHVVSNVVENDVRTVVATRSLVGITPKHFTFDPYRLETIHVITAVGSTPYFFYHKAHGPAQIALTATGTATCICNLGSVGELCETGGKNCMQFVKNCAPPKGAGNAPWGDLVTQKNPTCTAAQYAGGLTCCHHKRIMLDADQPVRPELLRYHMKFRFWFQEYKADSGNGRPSHHNLERIYYQTEANAGEYDIPPAFALPGYPIVGYPDWPLNTPTPGTTCTGSCPNGLDCHCEHTITYHWTVSNIRLIYAGGHCHAPSCISIELYRNDTGKPQLLCRQLPIYGQGNVTNDKWDEAGYVALPPCLWSDDDTSLEPSQWLPANTPMFSVKRNRNTHLGHFGEMASWQMRGVTFPAGPPKFI